MSFEKREDESIDWDTFEEQLAKIRERNSRCPLCNEEISWVRAMTRGKNGKFFCDYRYSCENCGSNFGGYSPSVIREFLTVYWKTKSLEKTRRYIANKYSPSRCYPYSREIPPESTIAQWIAVYKQYKDKRKKKDSKAPKKYTK